jgi:two-component system cell cycle sensor histidine kinase/response regulator CckA
MRVNILDSIDFEKVDALLEGFNKSTGFVTAILDLEGKVLSKSGWRQICTEFHRIHPETCRRCSLSDTVLAGKMAAGEKYHFYQCLNGLVDVAVPIIIKGKHVANLFSGQFFFAEPDRMFFKAQAAQYGFEEDKYLKALDLVPVVAKERVETVMEFLLNMTQLISETTFQRLEQMEMTEAIRASEHELRSSQQIAHLGSWRLDVAMGQVTWTEELYRMYGADPALPPPPYTEHGKLFTPASWERLSSALAHTRETGIPYELELETVRKDGSHGWMWVRGEVVKDVAGNTTALWGAAQDITGRKHTEEALRQQAEALRASNAELEQFNRAMVGREIRMIELKREINELCRRLGEAPRHTSVDEEGKK